MGKIPKGIVIAGTDTGVGKTFVGCGIASAARSRGLKVGVFKPFESGVVSGHEDFRLLKKAAGSSLPDDLICPYRFEEALAPAVAAERLAAKNQRQRRVEGEAPLALPVEGATQAPIDWCRMTDAFESIAIQSQIMIAEGAGGLMVPLAPGKTNLDLIKECEFPVLLVARLGLGTINHTLLSLEVLAQRGIPCLGVVLNQTTESKGIAEETNPRVLSSQTSVPILGVLPWAPDEGDPLWDRVVDLVLDYSGHT